VPETPNRTDMKKRKLRGNKKPRWLTLSKLPKQPFLATHATGQLKIGLILEKEKASCKGWVLTE
jgi:hypothetical protein